MESLFPVLDPGLLPIALMVAVLAGLVKGVVGFAMPLVMMSGLTLFFPPEVALAGLILPTVFSNLVQALRHGRAAAWRSIKAFRHFLITGSVTLVIFAQTVRMVSDQMLYLVIGSIVVFFTLLQLFGLKLSLPRKVAWVESLAGGIAGIMGGIAGIWGPPTVMYLTALNTQKEDQVRIQGVIYGLGSVALTIAHLGSGVLRAETIPFSAALILPGVLGLWLGGKVLDRIDQAVFRRVTLVVLIIAGLNLIRRGLF